MKSTESKESNQPTRDAAVIREAILADDERQYLTFMLGEEMFAIGILSKRNNKNNSEFLQMADIVVFLF